MGKIIWFAYTMSFSAVAIGLLAALWHADEWIKWTFGLGLIGACVLFPFAIMDWWHSQ